LQLPFTFLAIACVVTAGIVIFLRTPRRPSLRLSGVVPLVAGALVAVWVGKQPPSGRGQDFLDAQLWAYRSTAHDALFLVDPWKGCGWRDLSERSSFGSVREWGFTAIAHNPTYSVYQEGNRRLKLFGIDLDKITEADIQKSRGGNLGQELQ